jgi:hypothetical protein
MPMHRRHLQNSQRRRLWPDNRVCGHQMPSVKNFSHSYATTIFDQFRYGKEKMFNRAKLASWVCAMMAGATLFSSMSSGHVHQRDNGETTGWYPRDCCGNGDCRPATEVQQVGAGLWLKAADGTTVFHPTGDHASASQDRHWHFCVSYDHDVQAYVVRCVFAPQGASLPRTAVLNPMLFS